MSQFTVHTAETAPADSQPILSQAQAGYGFLPNLLGIMGEAPALLEAYVSLSKIFGKTSFSPTEQQIVLLSTSVDNGCTYCVAAHSTIAAGAGVDASVIDSLRNGTPITDAKLEALRQFTLAVVAQRGRPTDEQVAAFLAAGYGQAQILEVILGVGMKTLSNYTNHLAETPVDDVFAPRAWAKAS